MPAAATLEYVTCGVYGRRRDGALVLDVPTLAAAHGDRDVPAAVVARRAMTELRARGIAGLIIARLNGVGQT